MPEELNEISTSDNSNKTSLGLLILAGVVSYFLSRVTFVSYPFLLLSTWFHEMGHGLTCLFLGGNFLRLELHETGSGLAFNNYSTLFFGNKIGSSLISFGGLIGPPIAGATFIILGSKKWTASICLYAFSFMVVISVLIWVSNLFGIGVLIAMSIVSCLIAWKGSILVKQFMVQFIGIQAVMSTFQRMDYLFTERVNIGGRMYTSDVGSIAANLGMPYWFWGSIISFISVVLIGIAFKIALKL
ncbi:MAG: peptidase M50 [Planctomycetota bacterium]|nr:MAG: peptidase M50 [Planctomycetota bacterium]